MKRLMITRKSETINGHLTAIEKWTVQTASVFETVTQPKGSTKTNCRGCLRPRKNRREMKYRRLSLWTNTPHEFVRNFWRRNKPPGNILEFQNKNRNLELTIFAEIVGQTATVEHLPLMIAVVEICGN